MPYENMVIPLINFLKEIGGDFHKMNPQQKKFIEYWYWNAVFSLRYSGSSNERIIEDSNILILIAKGKKINSASFLNKLSKIQILLFVLLFPACMITTRRPFLHPIIIAISIATSYYIMWMAIL